MSERFIRSIARQAHEAISRGYRVHPAGKHWPDYDRSGSSSERAARTLSARYNSKDQLSSGRSRIRAASPRSRFGVHQRRSIDGNSEVQSTKLFFHQIFAAG
jgi:hypothetical protein